jgi:hypothetical protein
VEVVDSRAARRFCPQRGMAFLNSDGMRHFATPAIQLIISQIKMQ